MEKQNKQCVKKEEDVKPGFRSKECHTPPPPFTLDNPKEFPSPTNKIQSKKELKNSHMVKTTTKKNMSSSRSLPVLSETVTEPSASCGTQSKDWSPEEVLKMSRDDSGYPRRGNRLPFLKKLASGEEIPELSTSEDQEALPLLPELPPPEALSPESPQLQSQDMRTSHPSPST